MKIKKFNESVELDVSNNIRGKFMDWSSVPGFNIYIRDYNGLDGMSINDITLFYDGDKLPKIKASKEVQDKFMKDLQEKLTKALTEAIDAI